MRKINILEFVTLDGVMQTIPEPKEGGTSSFAHEGWQGPFSDEGSGALMQKQLHMPVDLLLGRVTFDGWETYWPQHADFWPEAMTATKYVASNTRTSSNWEKSVFLGGDIVEKIKQLKQTEGPNLHVYGSANLVQTLMKHDLVDAFWLKIYPVTLGSGKRLFTNGTMPATFKVTESHTSAKGVFFVNYERAGEIKTGSLA